MAHILIVTLGPIQDFIAAARRSRDLWFGSWLLSELSKATAKAIAEECGYESLIFPGVLDEAELDPGTSSSVANKIVARVPEGRNPATVALQGQEGLRFRLRDLCKEAFDAIKPLHFYRSRAEDQVEDLIEYAWVSAEETDDYPTARKRAESLLAARKNTRLWNAVSWGAPVPKSSIDGERESVLDEKLFESVGKKNGPTAEEVRKDYGVGPTERLCGVGLLKRHGERKPRKYAHRFLSTGHLAAWPLFYRAERTSDPGFESAWLEYIKALAEGGVSLREQEIVQGDGWGNRVFGRYDGSLLFENRLPELFEETPEAGREERLRKAKQALSEVLKKLGVSTPVPYYAILVADGDHMGKAIEKQKTVEAHQALSKALDRFAQSVKTLVEGDHGGELIYSGGDDVLAFVPLHNVVECAQQMAANFKKSLSEFPVDDAGNTPTMSAGISISHFIDPMRGAIKLAQEAEALAKRERKSLAVIMDKRSGPPVKVVGPWGTLDVKLKDYVEFHRNEEFPDGAAYELLELSRLTEGTEGAAKANLEELVRKEAVRILKRKQPQHGQQKEIEAEKLASLSADVQASPLAEVANRLIVARLIAQAAEEANPTQPKVSK